MFKIFREPELCELFSNFLTVNQHFSVHIILVHIILNHENLNKILKLSLKNGREPKLCEPFLWNYVNHGSREPWKSVNQGKM